MSDEQVVSVRLRRNTTSTPWGFRMQGGYEYGTPLCISQVNPKSLSHRLGLRVGDRLLAIGPVQAHNMSHEQAKMEIIRAGNELDLIVQRSPSAVIDQPDSRAVQRSQKADPVEESTEYRGYTNPNVQSRSFKILQESLSYSEANEEGIVLPAGNTPGEGIVHRAYSEGRRRLEELSELNPRNFTAEGESPYRVSEHYNIKEESLISERTAADGPPLTVAASKVYDGSEPRRRKRPTVDMAQSSVLSPAAGQQQYLEQAHEYYEKKAEPVPQQRERQTVNIAHSSVLSPAAGQQQYLQQAHEYYQSKPEPQARVECVPQKAVVHCQRPKERQLKLVNYQFEEQYGHLKKEPESVKAQKQGQVIQIDKQKAVVSPQKSGDFIPATEIVESVAADLHLKIVSSSATPQQTTTKQMSQASNIQFVTPVQEVARPAGQIIKPTEPNDNVSAKTVKSPEQNIKLAEQIVQHADQIAKPEEQIVKPAEETTQPEEQIVKQTGEIVKPAEQATKPEEEIVKPEEKESVQSSPTEPSVELSGREGKVQSVEANPDISDTKIETEIVKTVTEKVVNKFAEDLSASVVASAQQCVQVPNEAEKTTPDEQDGGFVSKETTIVQVKKKVESHETEQAQLGYQQKEIEVNEDKTVNISNELSSIEQESTPQPPAENEFIQTKEIQTKEDKPEQVSIEQQKSDQQLNDSENNAEKVSATATVEEKEIQAVSETSSEVITTAVAEDVKQTENSTEKMTGEANEPENITKETKVSRDEINEQASFTVEEVQEVNAQLERKSTEVIQTLEVDKSSEQKEAKSGEQTESQSIEVQSEEQFNISVEDDKTTSETVSESAELTFELSANETEAESSVAFEISTDAEISVDVSSDINFTTDVSADITTDVGIESDTDVAIAMDSTAKEAESAAFTISVAEEESESKSKAETPRKADESKQNQQNNSKPTRAKFVDSQGGVAARLARFKQK